VTTDARALSTRASAALSPLAPDLGRLIIVSNRLPVTAKARGRDLHAVPSVGGLSSALEDIRSATAGRWFGWHGRETPLRAAERRLISTDPAWSGLEPMDLSSEELRRFYFGYANGVIWPVFHYLVDRVPLGSNDWPTYVSVNQRMAERVAEAWREGDVVQVHDYHFMLVPRFLRELLPQARIGFFLHVPFPSSEIFRVLPTRTELLEGLLGSDLVGFHTLGYARHFSAAVLRVLGVETTLDRIRWKGRDVRFGAYPLGIDALEFAALARSPKIVEEAASLRADAPGVKLILGIDRLDYTKGIPRRLLAFEWLLDHEPQLRGNVRLLQIAAPSRGALDEYAAFKRTVDELVGRINGRFGTARYTPVRYLNRSLSREDVVALYVAADVMCVTPLRDGMNLVAKEFVATREGGDAVLVLSEFAGAATELNEAVVVNPYDVEGTGRALSRALTMPQPERRARLEAMTARVRANDIGAWNQRFLTDLTGTASRPEPEPLGEEVVDRIRRARNLVILLDYDGTLVPFELEPSAAAPDRALVRLLGNLAARRGTAVHVVSGRTRHDLEQWFDNAAISLHAEHGLWSRKPGRGWVRHFTAAQSWKRVARDMLEGFARHVPGSLIEEKSAGLVWHYRAAEAPAVDLAKELRLHLIELLGSAPVDVLAGDMTLEVRAAGVNKGLVVESALAGRSGVLAVGIGDDRTDEDLFAALPEDAITIGVGSFPTAARWRLKDWRDVRRVLRAISGTATRKRKAQAT
jgi:trehalose 6-phosphate synthase/phosphatase